MRTEDVLDQIDATLDDWAVGPDAARHAPDKAATIGGGRRDAAREVLVRRLVECHGVARSAALNAVIAAERGVATQHSELVQAAARAAAEEAMQSIRRAFRPMVETMAETMKQLAAAFERMHATVPAAGTRAGRRTDRPAWQSPYGPAPRRH